MIRRQILTTLLPACLAAPLLRAEKEREKPRERPEEPKEKSGTFTGRITKLDGGKVTIKGEQGERTFIPHWRGGMPDKGGGFDKEMLRRLKEFKVGDRVRVEWVFEEHYRVEAIRKID